MTNPADPNRSTRLYRAASPVGEEDIHPGAVIGEGRFKIFGIIGRGKMASVFRARDLRRNADVALKVLARKYVGHHDRERRFDNEARLAGRLQGHRNVVAPIESGRLEDCGGRMFLAMELVRGPTLADLVSMHGPLPIEDACLYMRDIARALRDLHQSGVVHRDVKPENVIVVEQKGERVAKLLDFGLAADTGAGADARMTRLGERPGTRHYMSPEQAWEAPAHPVFDVYALGVTFYEVLTGHPPFFELDEAEVIARKCDLSQPSPSIKGRREGLPERLEVLVDACLEPVAKKRLPSINAFLKRLDAATAEAFAGGMSPRTRQQTSMVGQARTIAQPKQKKSKLPEIMAQAAAKKQQAYVPEPAISPEAPTPDPDRVISRRAVNRAVEGLAQSAAALGGQPATVPHLQPTEPSPQARPVPPPAAAYGQGPGFGANPSYGAATGHAPPNAASYAQAPHAQAPHAQAPHAQAPHAQAPHAQAPHAQAPYASSQGQAPYASQGQAPYASSQGQTPYASQGQAPYASSQGQAPYASSQGQAPYASSQGQAPYASAHGQAPYASAHGQAPYASAHGQPSPDASHSQGAYATSSAQSHPSHAMGVEAPVVRRARPAKRRIPPGQRAIVFGLILGAVLSALLVVGLWMWISIRKGG
jgi:serine/threonine protein kinase